MDSDVHWNGHHVTSSDLLKQDRTGYLTADRAISEAAHKNFLPARVVCRKLSADRAKPVWACIKVVELYFR